MKGLHDAGFIVQVECAADLAECVGSELTQRPSVGTNYQIGCSYRIDAISIAANEGHTWELTFGEYLALGDHGDGWSTMTQSGYCEL